MITVNFSKARALTKDRLRAERAPLLLAQDMAFQRTVEDKVSSASVAAEKKRLRGITKEADAATTLDELKGISAKLGAA